MRADLTAISDEDLAASIAAQASEAACSELFRRYKRKIYLWCFGYAHDSDEAVDLSQEVFVKIFRNIAAFSHRSRFSTWVYEVARNHCYGELAKKKHQWRKRLLSIDGLEPLQLADERAYEALEFGGDVDRIMSTARGAMRPEEIEAFVLHYRDGLTVKEITATLRCENVTGARTLIQNARRKFKRLIAEKGYRDE